ncbi:MAG: hypothetical protein KFF68_17735 [Desulfosarcina sp.]|nr:hypothetical protein [Desulfosarcina sp.]
MVTVRQPCATAVRIAGKAITALRIGFSTSLNRAAGFTMAIHSVNRSVLSAASMPT